MGVNTNSTDSRKYLDRVNVPALIINSTRDPFVTVKISNELARGIAGTRLILADRDHLVARMYPELLVTPMADSSLASITRNCTDKIRGEQEVKFFSDFLVHQYQHLTTGPELNRPRVRPPARMRPRG